MILDDIAAATRKRVDNDISRVSLNEIKELAANSPDSNFAFKKALMGNGISLICEVKKASPSKGVIAEHFPYTDIAKDYELSGADCISVLTEPQWFLGSDEIFKEIRKTVSIPMLRKDFTIDEYQIYQAKAMGADAVLLICALLDDDTLKRYMDICNSLTLSALVETHDASEIKSAVNAGAEIIGVNNRNLYNFSEDITNTSKLRNLIPDDVIFVSESGIKTPEDAFTLIHEGADALLIGEALMRSSNKGGFISEIKNMRPVTA